MENIEALEKGVEKWLKVDLTKPRQTVSLKK